MPVTAFPTGATGGGTRKLTPFPGGAAPSPTPLLMNRLSPVSRPVPSPTAPFPSRQTQVFQKIEPVFPGTLGTLEKLQRDPLALKADPKKFLDDVWDAIKDPVIEEGHRIKDLFDAKTPTELYGKYLQSATGVAHIAFSPISALFAGAKDIPIVGAVAQIVELPFQAAGEGASEVSNRLIDRLPISDAAKEHIKPGVSEIFSLAAQLALGKAGEKVFTKSKLEGLTEKYGEKDAKVIVEKAVELGERRREAVSSGQAPAPVSEFPKARGPEEVFRDAERYAESQIRQGKLPTETKKVPYSSLKPTEDLSKLDQRKVTRLAEQLKTGEGTPIPDIHVIDNGDGTYSIRDGHHRYKAMELAGLTDETSVKVVTTKKQLINRYYDQLGRAEGETRPLRPVGGGTSEAGLAKGIEAKAIESGLTRGFGDIPELATMNKAEQGNLMADLLKTNPELVKDIAFGRKPAPEGMIPEAALVAIEDRAIKTGDVATLRDLAQLSGLSGEARAMGQRISYLAERNPDSPVGQIAEIKKIREAKVKDAPKRIKQEVESAKEEIRAKAPKLKDWDSFLDSLKC